MGTSSNAPQDQPPGKPAETHKPPQERAARKVLNKVTSFLAVIFFIGGIVTLCGYVTFFAGLSLIFRGDAVIGWILTVFAPVQFVGFLKMILKDHELQHHKPAHPTLRCEEWGVLRYPATSLPNFALTTTCNVSPSGVVNCVSPDS